MNSDPLLNEHTDINDILLVQARLNMAPAILLPEYVGLH